jgi:hypothetical protein
MRTPIDRQLDQDALDGRDGEAARARVLATGCRGCGSQLFQYAAVGALCASTIPAAIAGWFLLLHMLGQISRAVKGER